MPRKVKVPASVANIDFDRVRRALFKADGNVTRAAKALKVNSADLRRLTWRHPALIMDALEHAHRLCDKAEEKLREALYGDHANRALAAATFVLSHSPAASERGWSRSAGSYDDPARSPRRAVVQWADGTLIGSPSSSADQPNADAPVH